MLLWIEQKSNDTRQEKWRTEKEEKTNNFWATYSRKPHACTIHMLLTIAKFIFLWLLIVTHIYRYVYALLIVKYYFRKKLTSHHHPINTEIEWFFIVNIALSEQLFNVRCDIKSAERINRKKTNIDKQYSFAAHITTISRNDVFFCH